MNFDDGYKDAIMAKSDYWKRILKPNGKFDEQTQYGQLPRPGNTLHMRISGSTSSTTPGASCSLT